MLRDDARGWTFLIAAVAVAALGAGLLGQSVELKGSKNTSSRHLRMSSMGRAAERARVRAASKASPSVAARALQALKGLDDLCVNKPDCGEEEPGEEGPERTQSEVSIAVDDTGQHVVIGFNDFRGIALNPVSVSGFMYSDDGGQTFVDGGQLPSPGDESIGSEKFPEVFGDPEIEYLGGCTFIYASIVVKKYLATDNLVQTMGVHRSTDCGHSWVGPFEVTAASNPNGQVDVNGDPVDAADKEFMSVDPETGRVILSWTNFTPTAPEISTTYSDNILATPPTWSPRQKVAADAEDGQGSDPVFAGDSNDVYLVWSRFPFPGTFLGYGNTVGFARSEDNGETWSAPVDLGPEFFTMDHVLGNDRVNNNPTIAVDNSGGPHAGDIYVVYANNNNGDGADVAFQRSTDRGLTFSSPILLNSRPGNDRAQWFPWVTVDRTSGRVHVFYYDQGIAASGHLTEVTHTYSNDGGKNWAAPLPLTTRPFKAGWGNDTSQPNLGDYNQAVAVNRDFYAAFAQTERPPHGFVDGQPSPSLTVPDVAFRRIGADEERHDEKRPATLDLQGVSFTDSGGNGALDPGETARFRFTLRNYVTNPLNDEIVTGIQALLSTSTPGVAITQDRSAYRRLAPGAMGTNNRDFVLSLLPGFIAGTAIELRLDIRAGGHDTTTLLHTQFTGTPVPTLLLSEDFDGVTPGALPAGWTAAHGAGPVTVPWTTVNTFCGTGSNGAFHANDNVGGSAARRTRWERLFSPVFTVPASAEYLTVDFDVCYDTEDDPNFNVLAYDGSFLRLTDLTPGRTLRSVLAEAFEDEFTTGALFHYPRHLPRSSSPSYFEDMSVWAGYSNGVQHVRMRLPGVAGSVMQLRFEYTQDGLFTCADVRPVQTCGVLVDNVVVNSVTSAP